jgi:F0F1-type ATP synthase assembly protein I
MPLPRSVFDDYSRYAGVGLQFAATLAVFALLGWWGDGKLGTSPWLLLIGVFAGFGLGFYSLVSKFAKPSSHAPRPKDPPDQA